MSEIVDVTPTWESILPVLLELHLRDTNPQFVLKQFQSMAQAADKWNEYVKENNHA